jgi:hypothetical protein
MNWSCEQIEARLSDYLDGALAAGEKAEYAAHLASCARCAPLVESVGGMLGALHTMDPLPVPPLLAVKILDRTLGPHSEPQGWRAWLGWTRFFVQPRFAYGALTVFITMIVISQALGIHWNRPTVADLNPVNAFHSVNRQAHLAYARGAKFVTDLRVVYEIESRLQSTPEPETSPAPNPDSKGHSEVFPRGPHRLKHAGVPSAPTQVACALMLPPARSMP